MERGNDGGKEQIVRILAGKQNTPQDNRADFGPISPLPTTLGNVSVIFVDLKIIFSDFPVVCGVLRVTERVTEVGQSWL